MTEREYFRTYYDYNEENLSIKGNKNVFVKNTIMTKRCKVNREL